MKAKAIIAVLFWGLVIFAGAALAGPPVRPMVISGEALAEGKTLPEGTVLKFMAGQFELGAKVLVSEEGISYVRLVIPTFDPDRKELPGGREGDLVKFVSLGSYALTDVPPVKWKKGLNVKSDFLVKQVLKERPSIASASAVHDGEKWALKCAINPVVQKGLDPASVAYRLKWFYLRKTPGDEKLPDGKPKRSVFVKEELLKDIKPGAESTVEYKDKTADMKFFRLLLTPVMPDGQVGPSVVRDVVPVTTKGEL